MTSSTVPIVLGRQCLEALVLAVCGGSGVDLTLFKAHGLQDEEERNWFARGENAFKGEDGDEARKEIVQKLIDGSSSTGWAEEQVSQRLYGISHRIIHL
jgi:hypothetical protein